MNPTEKPARPRRPYHRSGLHTARRALQAFGARAIPKRTAVGRELAAWRLALIADLGGDDAISTQQRALVELAVRSKLLVDSIDAYLLSLPSLANKRSRVLWPVVTQRTAIAAQLQSVLRDLGLERRTKPKGVTDVLRELRGESGAPGCARA